MDHVMSKLVEFTMSYLDPLGVWVSLACAIPIFWIWIDILLGKRRRHKKWLQQIRKNPGNKPAVLIVDFLQGKNISASVEKFINGTAGLDSIPDNRKFCISRGKSLKPDDIAGIVIELREKSAEILSSGSDVLHLFYAGPVFAAALVGAEFSNSGCRVLLYQNDQGNYVNFGPLRHPGF
jgi:hypothetical protein